MAFTLGQGTGATVYNVMLSCISSANSVAVPNGGTMFFNTIYTTGTVGTGAALSSVAPLWPSNSIPSSGSLSITGLQCYPASGAPGAAGIGWIPLSNRSIIHRSGMDGLLTYSGRNTTVRKGSNSLSEVVILMMTISSFSFNA